MLIFGDKWEIKHGPRPSGEWANVFLSMDHEQLKTGIHRMRKDAEAKIKSGDEAWPPIPFEFACLCKTNSSLYFPDDQKYLPKPRANKDYARKQISKIREKLKP
jgi:hypothetical protein